MIVHDVDLSALRYGRYLQAVMKELTPLIEGRYTAVYDGPQFIYSLKKLLESQQDQAVHFSSDHAFFHSGSAQ